MSRFMTGEEIAAEQELMRQQRTVYDPEAVARQAEPITPEAADRVTPLDLLDSDHYVPRHTREERFTTCKDCERLFGPTRTCKECGCFMALKSWLKDATCPIGKW